ncbi:MAG TPA: DUF4396 domain-containing protein [Gaiellaceae bacterium]|nr:DUF4396 domain-containing protein [Gaiellaceae bacterium]
MASTSAAISSSTRPTRATWSRSPASPAGTRRRGSARGGYNAGIAHSHAEQASLNRLAASATTHCLTGCAVGEVLGVVIGTALDWGNFETIALAVVLAFLFGYSFTAVPLLRSRLALAAVVPIAFAADTFSITVMEIVDNAIILVIPGAMEAGLGDALFWGSLAFALAVAWVAAFPVNRWLISKGRGHAVVHEYHGH